MVIERQNLDGSIDNRQAGEAVAEFFAQNDYAGKRILLLIPDDTRSGPVGEIFKIIYDCLERKAKAVDILVALGTHQPMTEERICNRLTMTPAERSGKYASVKFFNHEWQKQETFTSVGKISAENTLQRNKYSSACSAQTQPRASHRSRENNFEGHGL